MATDKFGHLASAILNAKTKQEEEAATTKAFLELRPIVQHIVNEKLHGKAKKSFFDITVDIALSKIFIKLTEGKYDPKYAFSTWFKTITVNTCIDQGRKYVNEPLCIHDEYQFVAQNQDPVIAQRVRSFQQSRVEAQMMEMYLKNLINKSLVGINNKQRVCFMMRYIEDFNLKEIAHKMNLSLAAVKTAIFRGKAALKKKLEAQGFTLDELLVLPEETQQPKPSKFYTRLRTSQIDAFEAAQNPSPVQKVAA